MENHYTFKQTLYSLLIQSTDTYKVLSFKVLHVTTKERKWDCGIDTSDSFTETGFSFMLHVYMNRKIMLKN